jgi:hypothetical protein
MTRVAITLTQCDENTEARLRREIADVIAEACHVSLDSVQIDVEIDPDEPSTPAGERGEYIRFTLLTCNDDESYQRLWRTMYNPILETMPGYISGSLARRTDASRAVETISDVRPPREYVRITKWRREADALAYLRSPGHDELAPEHARQSSVSHKGGADVVHYGSFEP